jgi:glycosyltransferase involved in cell wall biosynthesis
MQNKSNDTTMPNGNVTPVILWLASWYPCRLDAFNGDFIQRSATALSLQLPVNVFYLMKDEKGIITKDYLLETVVTGQLTETRLYYHPFKTGIGPVDQIFSAMKYTRLGRKWLKGFKSRQEPGKPWIVEVGVAMRAGTLALWMKRKWKQQFLVQEHWTGYYRHLMPPELQRGRFFWKMNLRILQEADALFPDSRHLGEWINKAYLPIRFKEIPNTVNTELFHFVPNLKNQGKFRFIHVSTLGYQKNTDGILRCFKKLLELLPGEPLELLVVGPGFETHRAWVEQEMSEKDTVVFTGPKPYQEVAALMQTAHALVLFSRFENLPCVMLEAFSCGLPVIGSRVGGIAYHLPESNGLLVDSENETQLLEAMRHLYQHYADYDRKQIESDARRHYSMESIGRLYVNTYAEIYPHIFYKMDILVG